jgi:guanylate kinase
MQLMLDSNEFIESAEFSGNMYGTSKKAVQGSILQNLFVCFVANTYVN